MVDHILKRVIESHLSSSNRASKNETIEDSNIVSRAHSAT